MIIRDLVEQAVDADVAMGATYHVVARDEEGKHYSLKQLVVENGEDFEGSASDTGPFIILFIEEM